MTVRERNLNLPMEQIEAFCRRHPIRKLSLFGSALRDDFTETSDVDFLVEFFPGATPGLIKFLGMQYELEDLTGRKADLRTPKEFTQQHLANILKEAEALYVCEN